MTEQTNIPKPASPLPWTDRGSFGDADIVSASGDSVYREYPYEGGWFQEPDDFSYTLWAANNAQALYEALEKLVSATRLVRMVGFVGPNGEMEPSYKLDASVQSASAALKAARGEA